MQLLTMQGFYFQPLFQKFFGIKQYFVPFARHLNTVIHVIMANLYIDGVWVVSTILEWVAQGRIQRTPLQITPFAFLNHKFRKFLVSQFYHDYIRYIKNASSQYYQSALSVKIGCFGKSVLYLCYDYVVTLSNLFPSEHGSPLGLQSPGLQKFLRLAIRLIWHLVG